mmetsp:Transcript_6003/g.13248  ORF Transcript_6003/g.13248 Transcript_6003/m.13248 type:complete len:322 (-) Transcript_6003:191-1156(-)
MAAELAERLDKLEDRVGDLSEDLDDLRMQTLFALAETVIQARREASTKLIVYSFPTAEKQNAQKRDEVVKEIENISGVKPQHVQHAVREDSLSDFTVLTFATSGSRRKVIEKLKGRKLTWPGDARAEPRVRPQVCLFDRLKAVPMKAVMHLLTSGTTRDNNPWSFKPQWVANKLDGKYKNEPWQTIAELSFSTEEALCRLSVHPDIEQQVRDKIDASMEFIAYGKRDGAPTGAVPANSFRKMQSPAVRYAMNELKTAPLPFRVHVKKLPPTPPAADTRDRGDKRALRATPSDPGDRQPYSRVKNEGTPYNADGAGAAMSTG